MEKFRIYIWRDIKKDEMFKEIVEENKERINDYFTVLIFNTHEEMYKRVKEIESNMDFPNGQNLLEEFTGRTLLCRQELHEDDKPEIIGYSKAQGFIYLCDEDGLTYNTISHEVGHAVLGYMGAYFKDKFKITSYIEKFDEQNLLYEELFCYITGSLNNQICVKY